MKSCNNIIGNRPATFHFVKQCLNQMRLRVKKKNFFFHKFNQWCQPYKFSKWNLAIILATARLYSTKHFACWYHLLTADRGIWSGPSIWFAVTSRILLRICIKLIREITMLRNRKRNTKSFILYNERNFMWRRSEQSFDATHLVSKGVLVRFLSIGGLMTMRSFL
jgi:hypothetical protein